MVIAPLSELGGQGGEEGEGGRRRSRGGGGILPTSGKPRPPHPHPFRVRPTAAGPSSAAGGAAVPTWPVCSSHPRGPPPTPRPWEPPRTAARRAPASEGRQAGIGPGGGPRRGPRFPRPEGPPRRVLSLTFWRRRELASQDRLTDTAGPGAGDLGGAPAAQGR